MIASAALGLSLVVLAISVLLVLQVKRARASRHEISQRLHDQAMALDQRCDALQNQLTAAALHRRIDHIADLVTLCERQNRFDADVADRLLTYTLGLHDEAQQ